MSGGPNRWNASGVTFLFLRTSRGVAVAICVTLYLAAAVSVAVALAGQQNNRWLWLTGLVLGLAAGQYNNAIIRADHVGE
jgi:hypothetical protein